MTYQVGDEFEIDFSGKLMLIDTSIGLDRCYKLALTAKPLQTVWVTEEELDAAILILPAPKKGEYWECEMDDSVHRVIYFDGSEWRITKSGPRFNNQRFITHRFKVA